MTDLHKTFISHQNSGSAELRLLKKLPSNWRWVSLREISNNSGEYGASLSGISYSDDLYRYIRISDVSDDGSLNANSLKSLSLKEGQEFCLDKGDMLFARSGSVGRTYLHDGSFPAAFAGYMIRFKINSKKANAKYVFAWTQSNEYRKWLSKTMRVAAQPNINAKEYGEMPIALPPLAEQGKIAEILSDADTAIAKTKNKLDLMLRQLNGIRKSLISNSGRQIKLGQLCQPKQWKTITKEELTPSGYPVFGANAYIGFYHTYNHKADTIAVSCRGSCGEVSMIPGPSYITGNSMCLDNIDTNRVLQDYLFHCLKVADMKKIVSGSAQPQIILSDLEMFSIKIPDMGYQKKSSVALGDCMSSIEAQKRIIVALKKQKRGLMQKLLTGTWRVNHV